MLISRIHRCVTIAAMLSLVLMASPASVANPEGVDVADDAAAAETAEIRDPAAQHASGMQPGRDGGGCGCGMMQHGEDSGGCSCGMMQHGGDDGGCGCGMMQKGEDGGGCGCGMMQHGNSEGMACGMGKSEESGGCGCGMMQHGDQGMSCGMMPQREGMGRMQQAGDADESQPEPGQAHEHGEGSEED